MSFTRHRQERHGGLGAGAGHADRRGYSQGGGNAVDAAVAVGFALAVALPNAGNIGGGGFMMVHDAGSGKDIALDFREVAPRGASRNMYLDAAGKVIDGKSLYTHYAVGVPGTVAGMTHALSRWGSMPLARVMAPAIALADKGYPVSVTLAKTLSRKKEYGPLARHPGRFLEERRSAAKRREAGARIWRSPCA
jgi:gamma-glutamyltranspeptidase